MRIQMVAKYIAVFLLSSALTACSTFGPIGVPKLKEPVQLDLAFTAVEKVNPDSLMRPSPILVRVYELKNPEDFKTWDYFSLIEKDKALLQANMLAKDEFMLKPGETKVIARKSNIETTAIGILAAYQDLGSATWREVYVLKDVPEQSWYRSVLPLKDIELNIKLTERDIVIEERE